MIVKTFEIRDSGTFIPVLAVKLIKTGNENDDYLLGRSGLGLPGSYTILLSKMNSGEGHLDYYEWPGAPMVRTMPTAHIYIEENFDTLESGCVVDVEFILKEKDKMKESERFTAFI
jgi:hypothetical protein